jgi:hypothetical protein
MAFDRHLNDVQREALWKWRWLGWKNATPAFRVSMWVLAGAALLVAALPLLAR